MPNFPSVILEHQQGGSENLAEKKYFSGEIFYFLACFLSKSRRLFICYTLSLYYIVYMLQSQKGASLSHGVNIEEEREGGITFVGEETETLLCHPCLHLS